MLPRTVCLAPVLVSLALLSGCATPYRRALAPAATAQMHDASGVFAMQQHEIDTSINPSNMTAAAGGGLIWAIVDSVANAHSAKKNENFAADLRQALLDFKFEDEAIAAFTTRFSGDTPLKLVTLRAAADSTMAEFGALVEPTAGDAVLVVFPRYLMNPEFTRVVVTADVYFCAKSEQLRPFAKFTTIGRDKYWILYRNRLESVWNTPQDVRPDANAREAYSAAWATDSGRPAREALRAACDELAAMLQWDLAQPAQENYTAPKHQRMFVSSFVGNAALLMQGAPARPPEGNRVWVRITDGQLHAAPR